MKNYINEHVFVNQRDKDKTWLVLKNGDEISYKDFFEKASQYSNALLSLGVSKGDRVAVQIPKSPQALMIYVACVQIGAVFLPLNTAYTLNEIEYFVNDAGAKVLLCDKSNHVSYQRMFSNIQVLDCDQDGEGELSTLAQKQSKDCDISACDKDDLAAILYTSGTTGRSKGAMLTHHNLVSNSKDLAELWQFSDNDRLIHALPIFHTHGLFVATNVSLTAGCSMVFLPAFSVDDILHYMPSSTVLMGVPTFYTRLLNDERFDKAIAQNFRLFISGSAPLLAETHEQFYQRVGHNILERYGMTETNMNTSNPYDGDRRAGTVGLALPSVVVKVAHPETYDELERGEIGAILVKGDNVFKGYWNMPEKTAEEFTSDGFFITGDLGVLSEDGYLSIVGRAKDLIISGGYNIYPKEIESVIDDIDGVLESAVVGIPEADFGEAVVAVVVLSHHDVSEEDIASSIKDNLARFKHPRKIVIVDELPRNTMGKVQKNILREQYKHVLTTA